MVRKLKGKTIRRTLLPLVPRGCYMLVSADGQRFFTVMATTGNIMASSACFVYRPTEPERIPSFLLDTFKMPEPEEDRVDVMDDGTKITQFRVSFYEDANLLAMRFKLAMERLCGDAG